MISSRQDASQQASQETIPALNQLYFYLTEGCNLACRHCWLSPMYDAQGDRYATLPVELFEMAMQEATRLGLRKVKLTGGEPLMHPEITALIEIVQDQDLGLTLETNGLLCTPSLAAAIAKSRDRFVSVSIDGASAATHDWVRGVSGSFRKACQAVRHLAAAGIAPQVIMSLMRCNADQVEALVRMAEELGASSVKLNVVQPAGRGESFHNDSKGLNLREVIALGRYVDTELAASTRLRLFFDYPMAFRPLSRIASGNGRGVCGILGILGVLPDGHYALCGIGKHIPELVFGAVGQNALEGIWHENRVLQSLRSGLPDKLEGICHRCLMKHLCLGSCIAQNYYSSGSLWAPHWFCETASISGLFPESRLITDERQRGRQDASAMDQVGVRRVAE